MVLGEPAGPETFAVNVTGCPTLGCGRDDFIATFAPPPVATGVRELARCRGGGPGLSGAATTGPASTAPSFDARSYSSTRRCAVVSVGSSSLARRARCRAPGRSPENFRPTASFTSSPVARERRSSSRGSRGQRASASLVMSRTLSPAGRPARVPERVVRARHRVAERAGVGSRPEPAELVETGRGADASDEQAGEQHRRAAGHARRPGPWAREGRRRRARRRRGWGRAPVSAPPEAQPAWPAWAEAAASGGHVVAIAGEGNPGSVRTGEVGRAGGGVGGSLTGLESSSVGSTFDRYPAGGGVAASRPPGRAADGRRRRGSLDAAGIHLLVFTPGSTGAAGAGVTVVSEGAGSRGGDDPGRALGRRGRDGRHVRDRTSHLRPEEVRAGQRAPPARSRRSWRPPAARARRPGRRTRSSAFLARFCITTAAMGSGT